MREIKTDKLKTLATCKPSEFLRQTAKIKKSAEKWLKLTDVLNIRKKKPILKEVPKGASDEEKENIQAENRELLKDQARKNISEMLDSILDEHPDETLELLALCCFVEPENVDDYPVTAYMTAFNELINDEAVISFFSSLMQLVNGGI